MLGTDELLVVVFKVVVRGGDVELRGSSRGDTGRDVDVTIDVEVEADVDVNVDSVLVIVDDVVSGKIVDVKVDVDAKVDVTGRDVDVIIDVEVEADVVDDEVVSGKIVGSE